MVSVRCSEKIGKELRKLKITMPEINQGIVELQEKITMEQLFQLKEGLLKLGFEVLDTVNSVLMDSISELINELIYQHPETPIRDYPAHLKEKLGFDDSEVGILFLEVYKMTLLQYVLIQQVERIKEMLVYEGRSPKEITGIFHFKNGAQLTRIFQKITGLTPAYYKQIRNKRLEVRKENGFG